MRDIFKKTGTFESWEHLFEKMSPVLITPTSTSITVGLSQRFFLFQLMRKAITMVENDPYLNFLSLLKGYKVLGDFLSGTLEEFYRDRNNFYFKKFFEDEELYEAVKADIEKYTKKFPALHMTITRKGIIVYDNYKKNQFNVLLLTMHGGHWIPAAIKNKLALNPDERFEEEDSGSSEIYSMIVLEKGGIWVDNKQSRFGCDYNRTIGEAIYREGAEEWLMKQKLWREQITPEEIHEIHEDYRSFYFMLEKLVDAYRFNIIFDGHSMNPKTKRPEISIGTEFIPSFYLPIVKSMAKKLERLGYSPVRFNAPYSGGYVLQWLARKFPDVFIFSMEINKKMYIDMRKHKVLKQKVQKLSHDLTNIFDI